MADKHPNFFAVLPASVRYADIPANAKVLYAEVLALSNKNGYCHAQNQWFADKLNVAKDSVRTWLKQLAEMGALVIDYDPSRQGEQRRIYPQIDPFNQQSGGGDSGGTGGRNSDTTGGGGRNSDTTGGRNDDNTGGRNSDTGGPLRSMNSTRDGNSTSNGTPPSSNDSGGGATHPPTREGPTTVEWESPTELFDDAVPMPTGDGAPPQQQNTGQSFDVPRTPEDVREYVAGADVGDMPWRLARIFRALFCPWMDDQKLRQQYIGRLTREANRMVGEVNHDGDPMDKPRSRIELAVALLHLYQERDDLHGREDPGARKDQPTAALNVIADQITRKVKDDEQQPENDFRPDDPLHQLVRQVEQSHA